MILLLWVICLHLNTYILHRTEAYYTARTPNFKRIVEFVATVDVLFCTIFGIFYCLTLLLHYGQYDKTGGSTRGGITCYIIQKDMFNTTFNIVFTAAMVAGLRRVLSSALYHHQRAFKTLESHGRTLANKLFFVKNWKNAWTVACFTLLLTGPWVATSVMIEHAPSTVKTKKICMFNIRSVTILLPITICVTVISLLLISGLSITVSNFIKRMTRPLFGTTEPETLTHVLKFSGESTEDAKSDPDANILTNMVMYSAIMISMVLFILLIIFAEFYSDTTEIVRSQLAITLTSTFQAVLFYCGRDIKAPAKLSISADPV